MAIIPWPLWNVKFSILHERLWRRMNHECDTIIQSLFQCKAKLVVILPMPCSNSEPYLQTASAVRPRLLYCSHYYLIFICYLLTFAFIENTQCHVPTANQQTHLKSTATSDDCKARLVRFRPSNTCYIRITGLSLMCLL